MGPHSMATDLTITYIQLFQYLVVIIEFVFVVSRNFALLVFIMVHL